MARPRGRPRKGDEPFLQSRADGSVYMAISRKGSSSSHSTSRHQELRVSQGTQDPEPATPLLQLIREQTPEAVATPLSPIEQPPSSPQACSQTSLYCCCPLGSECPCRLPTSEVMAKLLWTQRVLHNTFPKPVYSRPDWVTYCLPHGKGLALTTLRLLTFKDVQKLVTWCTCNPAQLDEVHPILSQPTLKGYSVSECGNLPHECEHVQVLKVRNVCRL